MVKQSYSPQLVYVKLFESCNAGCIMCPYACYTDLFYPELDKIKELLRYFAELGIGEVRFTGGEPLLYRELPSAISYAKEIGLSASIITNGYLLNAKASELYLAGLDRIICSIDAPNAELHNKIRGKRQLFENAIAGLAAFLELSGRSIVINTVLSKMNYHVLHEFHPLLTKLNVTAWNLIPIKGMPHLELNATEKDNAIQQIFLQSRDYMFIDKDILFSSKPENCFIPSFISFVDLKNNTIYPCNCLPHSEDVDARDSYLIESFFLKNTHVDKLTNSTNSCNQSCRCNCDPVNIQFCIDYKNSNFIFQAEDYPYLFC